MQFVPLIIGAVSAASSVMSGMQTSATLKQQQKVAEVNRQLSLDRASTELKTAAIEEEKVRRQGREATAEQFAAFAQSGLGVSDFSTQAALKASATAAEMDAMTVRYGGELAATRSRQNAEMYQYEAQSAKAARKMVPIATALSAGTALLSGYAKYQGAKI